MIGFYRVKTEFFRIKRIECASVTSVDWRYSVGRDLSAKQLVLSSTPLYQHMRVIQMLPVCIPRNQRKPSVLAAYQNES